MKEINIIQFLPYFPPHKWWLETVAEELSSFYVAKWYWEVINIVFSVGQEDWVKEYEKNGYKVYVIPAFDIIPNFPVPRFWKREFWQILREFGLKKKIDQSQGQIIIQTHTRFFLSSFLWGLFAKYHKLKWIHIEHWSDYVKLGSKFKSKISYIYDKIIWAWIFKKADSVVAISEWVKEFIQKEFVNREVDVIYNWINFLTLEKQENKDFIKIWFVWRLVKLKWVDLLLKSFSNLSKKYENIILEIVWDWDERENLEKYVLFLWLQNKVNFLWLQDREYIKLFLVKTDILVNPSFQEWLPTTVLEWLLSSCVVVATDVGWTKEISNLDDLMIVNPWDLDSLEKWLEKAILSYKNFFWRSRDLVLDKFDWSKNIEKYFNLYNEVLLFENDDFWIESITNIFIEEIKENIYKYQNKDEKDISVIFLAWAPGSGKTEFVESLLEKNYFFVIDIDKYRKYFNWYNWKNASEYQKSCVKIANKLYIYCLKNDIKFIFDGTFRNINLVKQNFELIKKYNKNAIIYYIFQSPYLSYFYTFLRKIKNIRNVPIDVFISWFYDSIINIFEIKRLYSEIELNIWYKDKIKNIFITYNNIDNIDFFTKKYNISYINWEFKNKNELIKNIYLFDSILRKILLLIRFYSLIISICQKKNSKKN